MYYSKVRDVSHEEGVEIIKRELEAQNLTIEDLVKKMYYPFYSKGLAEVKSFFEKGDVGGRIRTKIGEAIGIDHELLHGEREFENKEDFQRFDFKPYLVKIPAETRPRQITFFGFVGFERVFIVGRFDEIVNKSMTEQLAFIKNIAKADYEERKQVLFFGNKLGYAFFYDYDQPAVPISIEGELLEDMEITYSGECSCSVSMSSKVISEIRGFKIPRLTKKSVQSDGDSTI